MAAGHARRQARFAIRLNDDIVVKFTTMESVMKTVTAADANRHFSKLLQEARSGISIEITSHGTPIARLVPANDRDAALADRRIMMEERRRVLFERLRNQPAMNAGKMTRDEIYERDD
jgi:prevent-host-death family protein